MSAETLVLLPGLMCDRTIWRPQIERFAAERDVVVATYEDAASFDAMAQAVLAQVPERFALAGHSMGARVALEIMRRVPERVSRLALFDTGVHGVRPGEAEKRLALGEVGRYEGMDRLIDLWLPPMVHERRRTDAAFMAPLRAMAASFGVEGYERQISALLGRQEAETVLPSLRCPVLVGVGDQDAWSPPQQNEAIASAIPGADFVVFAEAGHMAPVEAPDAVCGAMKRWLA